ncbi:MAG: DNA (cytosine-5-)-methyltransferase [Gammaproteobacteria bacterium]|nr:DNA (cytosine-5-)-methyltransferase [Gammaproteobacteria bacterium]
MSIDEIEHNEILELVEKELSQTPFKNEGMAVITHCLNSSHTIPYISDETYKKINLLKSIDKRVESKFTFIDLFAGIGGFRLALKSNGGKPLFSSEWDVAAQKTYYKNYGEYPFGDINLFTNDDVSDEELEKLIPVHDILAGGFPCQPFSRAGVSARNSLGLPHGFECKTQGTLFYSIERIAKIKKPKILLLENVRNLVSHDSGKTFETIRKSIEKSGYQFFYSILNSETLVPQRRVRCFIVGVRNDLYEQKGGFQFPEFKGDPLPLRSILDENPMSSYTISDKLWTGHKTRSLRNKNRGTGFTTGEADLDRPSNTIVARYGKDGKECLIPQVNDNPRMLTIDECKRLFGYPEDFSMPTFRTPAYKLLGNSVVVPVVVKIAERIVSRYFV